MFIGIAGKASSGKNTIADFITPTPHVRIDLRLFAAEIKTFARVAFQFTYEQVYGPSQLRNIPDPRYTPGADIWDETYDRVAYHGQMLCTRIANVTGVSPRDAHNALLAWYDTLRDGTPLTPRRVLQTLGTEFGRTIHPDVWVRLTLTPPNSDTDVVVIADCRFDNEFRAIRRARGELWHVERSVAGLDGEAGEHASERDLDGPILRELRTCHIQNDDTLDVLKDRVAREWADVLRRRADG